MGGWGWWRGGLQGFTIIYTHFLHVMIAHDIANFGMLLRKESHVVLPSCFFSNCSSCRYRIWLLTNHCCLNFKDRCMMKLLIKFLFVQCHAAWMLAYADACQNCSHRGLPCTILRTVQHIFSHFEVEISPTCNALVICCARVHHVRLPVTNITAPDEAGNQ